MRAAALALLRSTGDKKSAAEIWGERECDIWERMGEAFLFSCVALCGAQQRDGLIDGAVGEERIETSCRARRHRVAGASRRSSPGTAVPGTCATGGVRQLHQR